MQVVLIDVRGVFRSEDRWGRGPEANSSHGSGRKFPQSSGDATGGQLLLGGEDESEQNKHHQSTHRFWAVGAGESWLLKIDRFAVLTPFSTEWLPRVNFQTTSCSKDTRLWFVRISFSQQHMKLQFSVSSHWTAWNEQLGLVNAWIFAYIFTMQESSLFC